ncbi:MAG: hypothetical protein V4659_04125 [Pseudomonadota bacterium]
MLAFFTETALGRNLVAIGGLVMAGLLIAGALMRRGAMTERAAAQSRTIRAERAAHERINNAPTLRDSSDADRIDWVRDFARRHGN